MSTATLRIVRDRYRDEDGFTIHGRDTRGRRVLVFAAGERAYAEQVRDNIGAGRDPFDNGGIES